MKTGKMMFGKRMVSILLGAAMLLTGSAPACAAETDAPFKVAAVLGLGGRGDGSLSDAMYDGLMWAEAELGAEVQVIEPRELAEFEGHFAELARSGEYDLVIGGGFDQSEAMAKVAAEFQEQKFLLIDSAIDNATNVKSVAYSNSQRDFAVGLLAGRMTATGIVGVIGGADVPFLHNCVAGFMAGVRYANPDAEVLVKYTNDWTDTSLAKEMATAMYDSNADIVFNQCGGAGLGIYSSAEENDFWAIGTETNQNPLSPDHILCSALSRMSDTIYVCIQDAMEGTLEMGPATWGFAEGGVGYTTEGSRIDTPAEVTDYVDAVIEKVKTGEIVVPEEIDEVDAFLEGAAR